MAKSITDSLLLFFRKNRITLLWAAEEGGRDGL